MQDINHTKYQERISSNFQIKYGMNVDVNDFFKKGKSNKNLNFVGEDSCLCGHEIVNCCPVMYQDNTYIMGNCCIKRFGVETNKVCKKCNVEYDTKNCKLKKSDDEQLKVCKSCRNEIKMALKHKLTFGKYKSNTIGDTYETNRGYFNWMLNNVDDVKYYARLVLNLKQNKYY